MRIANAIERLAFAIPLPKDVARRGSVHSAGTAMLRRLNGIESGSHGASIVCMATHHESIDRTGIATLQML